MKWIVNRMPKKIISNDFKSRSGIKFILDTFGSWFVFFFIIYIILLIKAVTIRNIETNIFFAAYSIIITVYILSRFLLSYFHKSIPYNSNYEPSITFVVPAKNEEDNIKETIKRFGQVNYPKEKIEIIAINDGSTDNTLKEMQTAANEIRRKDIQIKIINWEINRGKRDGMAEGIKRAKNDIIIFVDSDSFIERDCVKHLVKYFSNLEVGAVSAHTDVYNRDTNLLTQMQAARYFIAFKVYKAAESIFGSVTCCPGCCSAYRTKYLRNVVDKWLSQKFLGVKCTFGDDRSLTNFIIKKYKAVYSPEAKAHTVVPDTFRKYFKQQQRWKKSWVRETFIASSFMWKKNPLAALSFYSYVFLAFSSSIVFFRAVIWHPYVTRAWPIAYLSGLFLMLLLHGMYYRIKVGKRAWFLAILSFWFHTILLIWQLPWAIVTIKDSRWGNR